MSMTTDTPVSAEERFSGLGLAFIAGSICGVLVVLLAACEPMDEIDCEADPGLCEGSEDGVPGEEWHAEQGGERSKDAASDVPGCESVVAFAANPLVFEGRPPWLAVDVSACGPMPGPRLIIWESGDGTVCEHEWTPTPGVCETVELAECAVAAQDTWSITMWHGASVSWSLSYDAFLIDGEIDPDYTPDSAIVCAGEDVGEQTLWDCTGLPFQRPTCEPITAG